MIELLPNLPGPWVQPSMLGEKRRETRERRGRGNGKRRAWPEFSPVFPGSYKHGAERDLVHV